MGREKKQSDDAGGVTVQTSVWVNPLNPLHSNQTKCFRSSAELWRLIWCFQQNYPPTLPSLGFHPSALIWFTGFNITQSLSNVSARDAGIKISRQIYPQLSPIFRHSLSGQILQTWDIVDISWFIYLDLCVLITLKYCQKNIQLTLTVVSTYFHELHVYLKHEVIRNKERINIKGNLSMF